MNKLDPALKRLLKWSSGAVRAPWTSTSEPETAPFGFSARVVASAAGKMVRPLTLLEELQQSAWSLTCGSLALIVCVGFVFVFLIQSSAPVPAAEISSALSFLANNFPL